MNLLAAAAVLVCLNLNSCVKENRQADEPLPAPGAVTLSASIDDALGRTSLGEGGNVNWLASDLISVFSTSGTNACFSLTEGAGTTLAKFSGDLEGTVAHAFFPWSDQNSVGASLGFDLPEQQTWVEDSFGPVASPMYAAADGNNLNFRNLCGVLKLQLSGADKVGKIILRDLGGKMLWGRGTLALDGSLAFTLSGGTDELELDCLPGVRLGTSPKAFYFSVPPGALSSGFTAEIYSPAGNLLDICTSAKDHEIDRSVIKPMKAKFVTHDLGFEETANCYVVYGSGNFKFKAVKGNGSETIASVSDAVVLWESNGTTTAPQIGTIVNNVSYSDGYVYLSTGGLAGNAGVAVRDAQGNILWSWHIWIPATKIKAATYSNASSGGVMDRNLGALVAEEGNPLSNGFTYQWGRKDPFPGAAGHASNNPVAATTGSFTADFTTTTKGTEEYVVAHPTEFLKGDKNVISNQDWMAAGNTTHWRSVKTIWDPCPPGYRVTANGVWTGLTFENGNYAMRIDGKHWYPVAGYRYTSDGAIHQTTDCGFYWTSTAGTNQATYGKYSYKTADPSTSTFEPAKTMARSAGLSVRCCTDVTPSEDPDDPETAEKEYFESLPSGCKVNAISVGSESFTLSFSNGDSKTIATGSSAILRCGDDGYWYVDGDKSPYKFADNPLYRVDAATGHWLMDGNDTGISVLDTQPSPEAVIVTSAVEYPRKVRVNFSDGSSLDFEKNISWGMYVQKTATRMYIYLGHANSDSWIRHDFYYRYKAYTGGTTYPDYYDNWGLGKPCTCTKNGNSFTLGSELFLGGEAEAAVQTEDARGTGTKTYSGGVLHGWENIYTEYGNRLFSIKVDGEDVSETGTFSLKQASKIEIEQKTKVARAYSPAGFANAYANVVKKWVIENGTVSIFVEYTFREETELFQGMFGMFCVKRLVTAKDETSGYITNLAWKDNVPNLMYTVTEGWESNVSASSPLKSKDTATTRIEEYGDAGVSFAMQYDGGTLKSKGGFKIGTNGNNYNKIYFDICGNYTAAQYEKLYSTVHWEIDYIKDYDQF